MSDLYESKTWQSVLDRGLDRLGAKSIDRFLQRPRYELYDVLADPQETNNLATYPGYADVVEKMQGEIRDWQGVAGDPWVVKWQYE